MITRNATRGEKLIRYAVTITCYRLDAFLRKHKRRS